MHTYCGEIIPGTKYEVTWAVATEIYSEGKLTLRKAWSEMTALYLAEFCSVNPSFSSSLQR